MWLYQRSCVHAPMQSDLQDLYQRTTTAFAIIVHDMLKRVKQEFDFTLDICRITTGSPIEHF